MIKELVKKNRSYRRFYQEKKLTRQQLMELVETARLTPSAANRQPFKYRIVCDEEENEKVFRLLGFAGYLLFGYFLGIDDILFLLGSLVIECGGIALSVFQKIKG